MRARSVVAVAVLALAVSGCSAQPQIRLVGHNTAGPAAGNAASLAVSNAAYDDPRSIGSMLLCVSSPATATITGVAPHDASGDIRVEAFAVRPNPFTRGLDGLGDELRPLAQIGGGFDPAGAQQVSGLCPTDAQLDDSAIASKTVELGVQVSWSSGDVAGARGLDVTYDIAGSTATALIPFGIWLCAHTCPTGVGS